MLGFFAISAAPISAQAGPPFTTISLSATISGASGIRANPALQVVPVAPVLIRTGGISSDPLSALSISEAGSVVQPSRIVVSSAGSIRGAVIQGAHTGTIAGSSGFQIHVALGVSAAISDLSGDHAIAPAVGLAGHISGYGTAPALAKLYARVIDSGHDGGFSVPAFSQAAEFHDSGYGGGAAFLFDGQGGTPVSFGPKITGAGSGFGRTYVQQFREVRESGYGTERAVPINTLVIVCEATSFVLSNTYVTTYVLPDGFVTTVVLPRKF